MEKLIPKASKRTKKSNWNDPRIQEARGILQTAQLKNIQENLSMSRSDVQAKKNHPSEAYENVNQEILDENQPGRRM